MAAKLLVAAEAAQDIAEAYGWYEAQRVGLDEEILECVDACMLSISRMPEMHQKVYKDFCRALVRRFPFAVYFEYSSETVTVYCVFHTSRDPEKWRKRLSS